MTRISPARRAALLVATLGAGLGGTVAPATPAMASAATGAAESHMTKLTFEVHGCEGCEIQPVEYIAGQTKDWAGKSKTVEDGTVSWTFRTRHTHGLSVWIRGPWEGQDGSGTNYVANVVWRY